MWQTKYLKAIENKKQLIGDKVIRDAVKEHYKDFPMLEEVRFPERLGAGRFVADLLVIDTEKPCLLGIEVKSDRDELHRLKEQLKGYLMWCNFVVVATTMMHKKGVLEIIENDEEFRDVGVWVYRMNEDRREFEVIREAQGCYLKNDTKWISKKHQLNQWRYLLEMIWEDELA